MQTDTRSLAGYVPPDPVVAPHETFVSVTEQVGGLPLEKKFRRGWVIGTVISLGIFQLLLFAVTYLLLNGTVVWGINIPIGWGFAIINFVWWIGIGHAGTLISAILLLLKQEWRMAIARFAEAMTLFAVACAGIFPILHTGRPWLAYWMTPYPNTMGMWPQFRSPLMWDVFAISTYATTSLLFWFVGMIPDLATLRDKAQHKIPKVFYGLLAMGWRGSARHWHVFEIACLLLAGLATPLVVSVHTIVSFDFAVSVIPGWHATIFPPYFVAGAVYSGFAMVLTLMIPVQRYYKLDGIITMRHIHNMSKVMLATGLIVGYGYMMEIFTAWYSGVEFEMFMAENRREGPYWWAFWALMFCNVFTPQFLWFKTIRENWLILWIISIIVNIGMWLERFVIVVTSLHRDFLPSSWDMYIPTEWDWMLYVGTIGMFLTFTFLFIRLLPIIAIFEVKTLVKEAKHDHGSHDSHGHGAEHAHPVAPAHQGGEG